VSPAQQPGFLFVLLPEKGARRSERALLLTATFGELRQELAFDERYCPPCGFSRVAAYFLNGPMEQTANVGGANDVLGYKCVEQLGQDRNAHNPKRAEAVLSPAS
jgi:hypothetical protein